MENLKIALRRLAGAIVAHRFVVAGLSIMAALLLALVLFSALSPQVAVPSSSSGTPAFTYAGEWNLLDLQRHIAAGEVVSITIPAPSLNPPRAGSSELSASLQSLAVKLTNGQIMRVNLDITQASAIDALRALGYGSLLTSEALDGNNNSGGSPVPGFLIMGILVVGGFLVIRRMMRMGNPATASGVPSGVGGADFQVIMPPGPDEKEAAGEARPNAVAMDDVAGIEEAKREVAEIIEFLRDPSRFARMGAKIPRGLLFYGPPGTGKTMLAKAIATEAGVPCVIASGSQFVEVYVGVGPKRVRALFALARKLGTAIVFIDEFDSLAAVRGGPNENSEDRKTVNELLTQLDGFRTTDNVVVIAATNRLDALDPAAIRPGRLSRKIHVPLPDVAGRRQILEVHARGKLLGPDADLGTIARMSTGMSGADLAEILNEAAIFAVRDDSEAIGPDHLRLGFLKVAMGTGRQRSMPDRERAIIAAHEAGHAVCGRLFGSRTRVEEVSLFAHGMAEGEALGFTLSIAEDNALPSESDLWADLVRLMGGRAAEAEVFSENTPGAADDFAKANHLASAMVSRWGMGRDPEDTKASHHGRGRWLSLRVRDEGNAVSTATAEAMERAIHNILETAYGRAVEAIRTEMPRLERVAAYLFTHERMNGEDFEAVYSGVTIVSPDAISAWRAGTVNPMSGLERPRLRPGEGLVPRSSAHPRRPGVFARMRSLLGARKKHPTDRTETPESGPFDPSGGLA